MAKAVWQASIGIFTSLFLTATAAAEEPDLAPIPANGTVVVPRSSQSKGIGLDGGLVETFSAITAVVGLPLANPQEIRTANTNVSVFVPAVALAPAVPGQTTSPNYFIETPSSIACIYGLVPRTDGCNPNVVKSLAAGGSKVIVVVDAFDAPNIKTDLSTFSAHFGLPAADLEIKYAAGSEPVRDDGWEIEISLDVEWAHAMAPGAKIVLVEAASANLADLMAAVDAANSIVTQNGGGEISMSWDGSEFDGESAENSVHFSTLGAIYLAASGDAPGVYHPASLTNVVGVGGTTIVRDANGAFLGEVPWMQEGAGLSQIELKPAYQAPIPQVVGHRGDVDIAAVADPSVGGVWVYDSGNSDFSKNQGWMSVGGTSVATPIVAGIINNSGRSISSSLDELSLIYSEVGSPAFNHVRKGSCARGAYSAGDLGWTFCAGVGSPSGKSGL